MWLDQIHSYEWKKAKLCFQCKQLQRQGWKCYLNNSCQLLPRQWIGDNTVPTKTPWSDNGTRFQNNLTDSWAKQHGIGWVYHIPCHAPASGKMERCNRLLKLALRVLSGGTLKHWDTHLAKAPWLVNTRVSTNRAGPAQAEGYTVSIVENILGKTAWVSPASGKGNPICGIAFAQGPGCTWWVMREDGEVQCVSEGDLFLSENSQ